MTIFLKNLNNCKIILQKVNLTLIVACNSNIFYITFWIIVLYKKVMTNFNFSLKKNVTLFLNIE